MFYLRTGWKEGLISSHCSLENLCVHDGRKHVGYILQPTFRIKYEEGRYLILNLKRFEHCMDKRRVIKLDKSVTLEGSGILQIGPAEYSLISFIVHVGTVMCGHYYAFVKDQSGA